jgi:TonB family protein
MRSSLFAVLLMAPLSVRAQAARPSPVQTPQDARAILETAGPLYNFEDPALKPWHLKATYRLYDWNGSPVGQGTWERWWSSPKVSRETWTREGITITQWSTADGNFSQESAGSLKYFEKQIGSLFFPPLPSIKLVDSGQMKLSLTIVPVGSGKLTCVDSLLQWNLDGKMTAPPSAAPERNCFEPPTMALRFTASTTVSLSRAYGHIVRFQGKYLAKEVVVTSGKQTLFSATLDVVDSANPADPVLTPPADAVKIGGERATVSADHAANVTTGSIVKKTQPVYPALAKMTGIQGTVVLAAVIGKDGRVRDLEVLTAPDKVLASSAIDAVKQWEYRPYLLNGTPVEVETVVNVVYAIGH